MSIKAVSRACLLSALLAGSISLPVNASGLPPEHEAERLMLVVEGAVAQEKWAKANAKLTALQALNVSLPVDHHFYLGLVQKQLGHSQKAQGNLEKYVVEAGKEGAHYRAALELLTELEELASQPVKEEPVKPRPSIQGEGDGYISSLKALYLTNDAVTALVQQANSLLSAHAYNGKRVKKANGREGILYSIAVNGSELLVQRKSYEGDQPLLTVEKLNVLGVDPFLEYACSDSDYLCWIYHPSKENERWVLIDRDELVAGELSQALSKLIRQLQAGS